MATALTVVALSSLAFAAFPLQISKEIISRSGLLPRQTQEETLTNQIQRYKAVVEIGTPGQQITLIVDTGSSGMYLCIKSEQSADFWQMFGFLMSMPPSAKPQLGALMELVSAPEFRRRFYRI